MRKLERKGLLRTVEAGTGLEFFICPEDPRLGEERDDAAHGHVRRLDKDPGRVQGVKRIERIGISLYDSLSGGHGNRRRKRGRSEPLDDLVPKPVAELILEVRRDPHGIVHFGFEGDVQPDERIRRIPR